MKFGVNDLTLSAFNKVGINPTLVRGYNPPNINVPTSFPGPDAKTTIKDGTQVVSFRPNIKDVLAGKLDAKLETFFATVPSGAYVSAWAEGEGARFKYSPQQIIDLHAHLKPLFDASAPLDAFYGQIFMSYSASPMGRGITPFVCYDLDFYGIDLYGDGTNKPQDVLGAAWNQFPLTGRILVTESNTPNPSQAVVWHSDAYRLSRNYGATAYMPYFGTGAGSHVFNPANAALVAVLKESAEVSR